MLDVAKYFDLIAQLLSPPEWRALALMLIMVTGFVEAVKRILLVNLNRQRRKQYIYAAAFVSGIVGAWLLWPKTSLIPWYVFAPAIGPIVNSLHWITLTIIAWKFPSLADVITGRNKKKPPPA